jgi:hypothetical protein
MIPTNAYAVHNATGDPTPWSFEHRDPGPHEILIDIHFCGICHTDIHQARNEGIVAKSGSGSDRVRRVHHRDESLQMASLPWRCHSLVCAVVLEVSDLICAHGRDGARTWSAHPLQLHLALGPGLRSGTEQALPSPPETHQ